MPDKYLNPVMDWNDTILEDGRQFLILPEGDYEFEVTKFERGRYSGGAKIPACNMAKLTLQVKTDEGVGNITTNLMLYRSMEWKVSSFFRCIGKKKSGEPLVMNWDQVEGARGRAHIKPGTYTGNDGNVHDKNEVDYFIDYDPEKMSQLSLEDELPF